MAVTATGVWTGGGVVFGPSPRHYTVKVNRKARRAAFASALSLHAQRGSLAVFDAVKSFDAPSTADAAARVESFNEDRIGTFGFFHLSHRSRIYPTSTIWNAQLG